MVKIIFIIMLGLSLLPKTAIAFNQGNLSSNQQQQISNTAQELHQSQPFQQAGDAIHQIIQRDYPNHELETINPLIDDMKNRYENTSNQDNITESNIDLLSRIKAVKKLLKEIRENYEQKEQSSQQKDSSNRQTFFDDTTERLNMFSKEAKDKIVAHDMNVGEYQGYPGFKTGETERHGGKEVEQVLLFKPNKLDNTYNLEYPDQSGNTMEELWDLYIGRYSNQNPSNYYMFQVNSGGEQFYLLKSANEDEYINVTKEYHGIGDEQEQDDDTSTDDGLNSIVGDFKKYIKIPEVPNYHNEFGYMDI
ncbi:hypothetical protein [Candidatus Absconditicoccus praedator]|uniref:hypothetical protein n=1 Tax=Candidatus Absconditicoccus praedator TaxID=2735562 RepID=UPI001E49DD39|nr:hypothetical protein [Candidatus Absconditicoccus praedator]